MTRINLIPDIRSIIRWKILIEDFKIGAIAGIAIFAIGCAAIILVGL